MSKLRKLESVKSLSGQRVLVRVDYNVSLTDGKVAADADAKLRASLPTIRYLINHHAKVILVSHLGRPTGPDKKNSLKPVVVRLEKILRRKILFVRALLDDGHKVDTALSKLADGQVALLENIRFYPGEEKNDAFLARRLAGLADIFVNDAFAAAHRAHASTVGVTKYLPSYAGKLMAAEIASLDRLLQKPRHPFVVLMGGAKISSKLPTLQKLLKVADQVLLGGGIANSFFRAKGWSIGKSPVSREDVLHAKKLLKNKKIILPIDVVAASSPTAAARLRTTTPQDVHQDEYVLDVGHKTVRDFAERIKHAQTIAWNGPTGLFEVKKFSHATIALGRIIAARAAGRAFAVVGGGETITALERTKMYSYIDHVSTGGGAMLEYLSGAVLPGIKPLLDK